MLGRGRWQLFQAGEFALGSPECLLGEPRFLDPFAQFVRLGDLLILFPELGLNRLELLTQKVLSLALVD